MFKIIKIKNIFKRVTRFKYWELGNLITQDENLKMKISTRIRHFLDSENTELKNYISMSENTDVYDPDTTYSTICLRDMLTYKNWENKIKNIWIENSKGNLWPLNIDTHTGEFRKRYNWKIKRLFERPNIAKEI